MCLAQGPQGSDASEARTRSPWVWSQALYHWATAHTTVLMYKVQHLQLPLLKSEKLLEKQTDRQKLEQL